jgi:hypothetical protein
MGVNMMLRIFAAALAAALAGAAAFAVPGDVISHFSLSGNIYPVGAAMYRDATYAYGIYDAGPGGQLRRFTPAGSLLASFILPGATRPLDAGACHLGAGYMIVLDGGTRLLAYHVATGSLLGSLPVPATADGLTYGRTSGYYYGSANNYIYRITTAGSLIGSFSGGPDAGTLAATGRFAGQAGEYVIVNPKARGVHPTRVYTGAGSFVSSFTFSGPFPTMDLRYGAVAGDGFPSSHGTTMWLVLRTDFIWRSAYQIDLGNAGAAVVPASLGAVKALFR